MMRSGPLGLLFSICALGGPHPCLDRLLDHPRCVDILERLLSFIGRLPEAVTASREELVEQNKRNPCCALASKAQSSASFV